MSRIEFTEELKADYHRLFTTCVVRTEKADEVETLCVAIEADRERYRPVADALETPWFVVAVLHILERQGDFSCHFHNGDPLTERTSHMPDGRPEHGEPPFTWEASAIDALKLRYLDQWQDWSIPGTLFKLEEYGGWGYRMHHPDVLSPYLWGGSEHYEKGKYVTEESWSDNAIFSQCGAAVLLRRLAERGQIEFSDANQETIPVLRYSAAGAYSPWIRELQVFMNRFPGIFVKVDGIPSRRTSEAFHKLTGQYLQYDTRNAEQTTTN